MKIWEITIINAFGIDEQTISVGGKNLLIEGGTGTGKTSILDSIDACFFGPKERVIRDESRPSRFIITTEEYEFDRVIEQGDKGKPTTKSFEIRRGDVKIKSPQTFAGKIIRAQSMRPLVFFEATPADRRAMLLRALPMELNEQLVMQYLARSIGDLAATAEEAVVEVMIGLVKMPDVDWDAHGFDVARRLYKTAYETRTNVGRDLAAKQSVISGIRALTKQPYDEKAHNKASRMLAVLQENGESLKKINEQAKKVEEERSRYLDEKTRSVATIENLRAELAVEEEALRDLEGKIVNSERIVNSAKMQKVAIIELAAKNDPECADHGIEMTIAKWRTEEQRWRDVAGANAEVDRQTNSGVEEVAREVESLEAKRAAYDAAVKFTEKVLPAKLIDALEKDGRLPLKGLAIDGEKITFNGKSIDVLSSGERMHFCMQLTIAILQPLEDDDAMKLICVDDFERIDPDLQEIVSGYEHPGEVQFIKTQVKRGALNVSAYDPRAESGVPE